MTNPTNSILPCPSCGTHPKVSISVNIAASIFGGLCNEVEIRCPRCGIILSTTYDDGSEETNKAHTRLIKAWNGGRRE